MRRQPLLFLIASVCVALLLHVDTSLFIIGADAAARVHGTRSLAESKSLQADRRNTLHLPIANVVDLKVDYFEKYIKPHAHKNQRNRYWLVLFYASWCVSCDEYVEPLTALSAEVFRKRDDEHTVVYKQKVLPRGQLGIGKHDITVNEVLSLKYNIEGVPTLLLFDRDDDQKITKYEGAPTLDGFLAFLAANTDVKL